MRARTLTFTPPGLTLEAELVSPDEAPRALVILCHGIPSGAPPDPADQGYRGFADTLAEHRFAAIWFNFRGCRGAPGEFSADGWAADLHALLDLALDEPEARAGVIVVGSSMGGATAIAVCAARDDVAAVATLAAPASFEGIVADPESFLHQARNAGIVRDPAFPPDVASWARAFDELAAVHHVPALAGRPLLLIHGDEDVTVPYLHAEQLFAVAGEPKELVRLEHGAHQLRRDPRAVDALVDWLERRASARNAPSVRDGTPSVSSDQR